MMGRHTLFDAANNKSVGASAFVIISKLDELRGQISTPRLEEIRLLTCNVGKSDPLHALVPSFLQLLADRFGEPVRGYTDAVWISGASVPPVYAGLQDEHREYYSREWPDNALQGSITMPSATPPAPPKK
jgi:hypothetical protein